MTVSFFLSFSSIVESCTPLVLFFKSLNPHLYLAALKQAWTMWKQEKPKKRPKEPPMADKMAFRSYKRYSS